MYLVYITRTLNENKATRKKSYDSVYSKATGKVLLMLPLFCCFLLSLVARIKHSGNAVCSLATGVRFNAYYNYIHIAVCACVCS